MSVRENHQSLERVGVVCRRARVALVWPTVPGTALPAARAHASAPSPSTAHIACVHLPTSLMPSPPFCCCVLPRSARCSLYQVGQCCAGTVCTMPLECTSRGSRSECLPECRTQSE